MEIAYRDLTQRQSSTHSYRLHAHIVLNGRQPIGYMKFQYSPPEVIYSTFSACVPTFYFYFYLIIR